MERTSKIYVAGHGGLVGSALIRRLQERGYLNLITCSRNKLDLMRQSEVEAFFENARPEYVFLAAAKVGGILSNSTYPAEFIYSNLSIQTNVIHAAWKTGIRRLLFLGSSCIYPRDCPQPMKEEYLLSGSLEPTNASYALAKIAGIQMCQSYNRQYGTKFLSVMPTNLYGPNDNFNLETSHVLPALIRRFHEAKAADIEEEVIWGTGKPLREFLHVDDLVDACLCIMKLGQIEFDRILNTLPPMMNIGTGKEISIQNLVEMVSDIVGYKGMIKNDLSKPDGTPRKLLDVSRISDMGWKPKIPLETGIQMTYEWYLNTVRDRLSGDDTDSRDKRNGI